MTYDPFLPGPFPVSVRTIEALDAARGRCFPCETWRPAHPGTWPLILFSHSTGGGRRQSTFLCTHLASHGYVVAAMDHSETLAPDLARQEGDTATQKAARMETWMANRLLDIRFLLAHLLDAEAGLDPTRIGIVGHSFGGWTALAAPEVEPRLHAVVALAPTGSSLVKPGIIPARLRFTWGHDLPVLYLVAENDSSLPLAGMYELLDRTPATKQMVILRRADHLHFMDDVEQRHEAMRAMPVPPELAWMQKEMRPIAELSSGAQAHEFVRSLALCHLDAVLNERGEAKDFLAGDLEARFRARGIDVIVHRPSR